MKPDISVVIPTNRKSKRLHSSIEAVFQSASCCNIHTQIIVVDSSKTISTLSLDRFQNTDLSELIIVRSRPGANCARNQGLLASKSDIVLFIDDDCLIEDFLFLKKHLDFHNLNKLACAAGGKYVASSKSNKIDRFYVEGQNHWLTRGILNSQHQINYLIGGNVSFKKNILSKNNLYFDENIIYGGSETELFVRIKNQELTCYLIDAEIVHLCDMTIFQLCKKAYKQGKGKRYREKKHSFLISDSLYVNAPVKDIQNSIFSCLQRFFFRVGYGSN